MLKYLCRETKLKIFFLLKQLDFVGKFLYDLTFLPQNLKDFKGTGEYCWNICSGMVKTARFYKK